MGFQRGFTAVPIDPMRKSVKLDELTRWNMLARAWHLPCLRIFAVCLLFSMGVQPGTANFAACSIYDPRCGLLWGAWFHDTLLATHGRVGARLLLEYVNSLHPDIAQRARPYLPVFDSPDSERNSFTAYRRQQGFVTSGCWLPDLSEADNIGLLRSGQGTQVGFHLRASAVPRLVGEGLCKRGHVRAALSVTALPFDAPPPLARATKFAVDSVLDRGS